MKYMMLIYQTEAEFAGRTSVPDHTAPWMAYTQELIAAGVMAGGSGLQGPHAATTLRVRDGKTQVQDGPYAETKEQLGGFYMIDVPDLDAALHWAARCPSAPVGVIEVRPALVM